MAGVYFDPVFFIEKNKLVLDSVHGLTKARDGTVWAKTAPPFGRRPTPASNIFHPPPKQVIHSRSLSSVGATYKRRELVRPQIERRSALTNISLYLRSILTTALSVYSADEARQEELVEEEAHTAKKHGRCHVCPRRKDTKKVQRCSSCNNFVCKSNVKEQVVYQNCC
ncbi:hypothetical protein RRG08_049667 [Elysia crispata]|uniref:PiggyBac transposable element-derived protein 4 C-terminal zinc-ribbon domain-containing protein n=1 Tax=Elysia crispata TaxID=231223 RepID=A0AAE0Y755_9GAST|nr:hypothetical protein RRG08_049667 [Elysia crispata]